MQGWGVAVLVGVPNKDDAFKTHPMNLLNERTLKGTFFGNYKPRTDIPGVVEKYMNKVKKFSLYRDSTILFQSSSLLCLPLHIRNFNLQKVRLQYYFWDVAN